MEEDKELSTLSIPNFALTEAGIEQIELKKAIEGKCLLCMWVKS